MIARVPPSFSQAQGFPSFSQASNCFVTFDFGAGFPLFILEVVPGKKATRPAAPPRTGYTFGGWFTDAGHTAEWDFNTTVGGDNFTLYAKWTAVDYSITYYLNGGINDPLNPASYTVEDPDIALEKPSRGEDEFVAWYEDVMFSHNPIEVIHTQNARNVLLYARFLAARKKTVIAAQEPKTNRFEGDPKLYFTDNGADLRYEGGQPVMEQGLENQIFISLFTRRGWAGNVFLPSENHVGSDYEETCAGAITRTKLADIEDAAIRAMTSKAFKIVNADAINPRADTLLVRVTVGPGGVLSFSREGGLWRNQIEQRTRA